MNTRTYPMLTSAPPLGARRQGGGTSAHKQTNASQHLPHLHFLLLIKHLYIYDEVHITRRLFSPAVVVGPGARRRDMVPHQGLVTTRLLVRRPTVLPVVLVPRAHPGVVVGRSDSRRAAAGRLLFVTHTHSALSTFEIEQTFFFHFLNGGKKKEKKAPPPPPSHLPRHRWAARAARRRRRRQRRRRRHPPTPVPGPSVAPCITYYT